MGSPTVYNMNQGSPEWHMVRRGVPTASNFSRIMTPKTGKPSSQMTDYAVELIAEMATGEAEGGSSYTSRAMQDGIDTEPEARRWYGLRFNRVVDQVGFLKDSTGRFGASPDGLIGDDGGLELKVPYLKTHCKYLNEHWGKGTIPAEYMAQVHGCLIVSGRDWWDFCSYTIGMPPLVIRVTPNDFTDKLRGCLEQFWEVFEKIKNKPQFADIVGKFETRHALEEDEILI